MNQILKIFLLCLLLSNSVVLEGCGEDPTSKPIAPSQQDSQLSENPFYAGSKACAVCHHVQYAAWQTSHHAYSMQQADANTVLGDFDDTVFTQGDQTSRFSHVNNTFMVKTDGPDGQPHEYQVAYTFGHAPLQQYLIPFSNGHFQALGIAWDTRSAEAGGQRWFHLYPNERIDHTDPLHWTGPNQNWNYMCADCHSTNLQKNFDLARNTYKTTWADLNVGCEACHGPGSHHVNWARVSDAGKSPGSQKEKGLTVEFPTFQKGAWQLSPGSDTATPQTVVPPSLEIDTCARCHSRRSIISESAHAGEPFLDHYLPALLEERLYHPDGQIAEEVYVYGSFLQSKMYQKGVTCHDCHEPHSLKLRVTDNRLCTRCHRSDRFDSPSHYFHQSDSAGARCVECHMPAKTYMVVDPRRDHSLRIPRPDLSVTLGTPNACTQCHKNRTPQWAAGELKKRYGDPRRNGLHYGEVLDGGRKGNPGADVLLSRLVREETQPEIVRASALSLLSRYPGSSTVEAVTLGLHAKNPLVRIGALRALEAVSPQKWLALARHLLTDKIRAVKIEAGRRLASIPLDSVSPADQVNLNRAVEEYLQAQWVIGERPEAHLSRGLIYMDRGQFKDAEEAYQMALKQDEKFFPALVNLADLYRVQNRDQDGEAILRKALTLAPDNAEVLHALGLLLVRSGGIKNEALGMFEQARKLRPENPRYGYVYAVALSSAGKNKQALAVLEGTYRRHPNDPQLVFMIASLYRDEGNRTKARQFAEQLLALAPHDPGAHQLLESIKLMK